MSESLWELAREINQKFAENANAAIFNDPKINMVEWLATRLEKWSTVEPRT